MTHHPLERHQPHATASTAATLELAAAMWRALVALARALAREPVPDLGEGEG